MNNDIKEYRGYFIKAEDDWKIIYKDKDCTWEIGRISKDKADWAIDEIIVSDRRKNEV